MNAIRNFFIRSPHWQVFAVLIGLFSVGDVAVVVTYPKADAELPIISLVAAELCWICLAVWFWSLGSFLSSSVRPDLRLNSRFFGFALAYPPVYMGIFQIILEKPTTAYVILLFPFHLLAVLCVFYVLNFVSKSLATAETGKPVTFYDYAGPFFLLWFFPFGIWFVQPRINRIYAGTLNEAADCIDSSPRSG